MRARNIKPGFFKNEDLAECSFAARYMAPGLWMLADKQGRLEDRPKRIKMELFPADDVDVDALLSELDACNHIKRYSVGGKKCIQILHFVDHQTPHPREKESEIPPLSEADPIEIKQKAEKKPRKGVASARPRHGEATPRSCRAAPDIMNPDIMNPDIMNPFSPKKRNATFRKSEKGCSLSFEKFWKAYPPTGGPKKKTYEVWNLISGDEHFEKIMAGLEANKRHRDSKIKNNQFAPEFPYPQRWLRDRRWEDYLAENEGGNGTFMEGSAEETIRGDPFLQAALQTAQRGGEVTGQALAHVIEKLGENWRNYAKSSH